MRTRYPDRGNGGFKRQFLDSGDPKEDVTHHIAAYLGLGAEGKNITAALALLPDAINNEGDHASGLKGLRIGNDLFMRPSNLALNWHCEGV